MILLMLFLSCLLGSSPVMAKSFSTQYILTSNSINIDFYRVLNPPISQLSTTTPSPVVALSPTILPPTGTRNNWLVFTYKLSKNQPLPNDLPLFLVVFEEQVLFAADASLADGQEHQMSINLQELALSDKTFTPIFYQNNYLQDFELEISGLAFSDQPAKQSVEVSQLDDLTVVREADQSLTVIFKLDPKPNQQHFYQLVCLNDASQVTASKSLLKTDDFLWPKLIFGSFAANQKNELIFSVSDFICDGQVYVKNELGVRSIPVSIIKVSDL